MLNFAYGKTGPGYKGSTRATQGRNRRPIYNSVVRSKNNSKGENTMNMVNTKANENTLGKLFNSVGIQPSARVIRSNRPKLDKRYRYGLVERVAWGRLVERTMPESVQATTTEQNNPELRAMDLLAYMQGGRAKYDAKCTINGDKYDIQVLDIATIRNNNVSGFERVNPVKHTREFLINDWESIANWLDSVLRADCISELAYADVLLAEHVDSVTALLLVSKTGRRVVIQGQQLA